MLFFHLYISINYHFESFSKYKIALNFNQWKTFFVHIKSNVLINRSIKI